MYCKIDTYSHHFTVSSVRPVLHPILQEFTMKQVQFKLAKQGRRWFRVIDKVYATRSNGGDCYRFHINHLKEFLMFIHFKGITEDLYEIRKHRPPNAEEADLIVKEGWHAKPDQVPIVDYILEDGVIKVITLQMGQGKTFCALYSAAQESTRLLIQVLARFTGKWYEDVKKTYAITDDRILQVRGLKALMKFMRRYEDQPHRFQYDVFIISTNTWIDYIKDYERNHETKRPKWYIPPHLFVKKMGIGQSIVDEVHMHFHWNFKVSLYMNIPKVIYLSATLDDLDSEVDIKMYNVLVPKALRRDGGVKKVYTNVYSYQYDIRNIEKVKYKGDKGQYSHVIFENSVRRNKELYKQYFDMISQVMEQFFIENRTDRQKALVFFGLTEMCAEFRDHEQSLYPNLIVSKYTSEDDVETLIDSHYITSTLGSSGTAIDIPDLLVCAKTVALSKSQTNLQAFGRLRDLGDRSEINPIFIYFTCVNNPKHMEYDKKKADLLRQRALKVSTLMHTRTLIA